MDSELYIEGYDLIRSDRNRHDGGVVCYIKKDSHYNVRKNCPTDFENIFLDHLLPNSKPILIGILYRPPDQSGFLDMVLSATADMEDFDNQEAYILADLNFNLVDKSKYILDTKYSKVMVPLAKKYSQFCCMHNLKQLIMSPTRVSKATSTLLDHFMTNSNELVSHSGVLDIGLSDHQLVFCTRKIQKTKYFKHKTIKTRSLKNIPQNISVTNSNMLTLPM